MAVDGSDIGSVWSRSSVSGTDGGRSVVKGGVHSVQVFLTYAQCSIVDKREFEREFVAMLERNGWFAAEYYGGRELHVDGGVHYHVYLHLPKQPNWSLKGAREKFKLERNAGESLHIAVPNGRYNWQFFQRTKVRYAEKDGDTFGVRPRLAGSVGEDKKKVYRRAAQLGSEEEILRHIMENAPADFFRSFGNVQAAARQIASEKDSLPPFKLAADIDVGRLIIPDAILKWECETFLSAKRGRPRSLLIVGESRTGKSVLAQYLAHCQGVFSEFDTEWNVDMHRPGSSSAVFHDMSKGFPYWRAVVGCQPYLTAHGRYRATKRYEWGIPSIWTCNWDNDPRDWSDGHRSYIEANMVVYEVPVGRALYRGANSEGVIGQEVLFLEDGGGPQLAGGAQPDTGSEGELFVAVEEPMVM